MSAIRTAAVGAYVGSIFVVVATLLVAAACVPHPLAVAWLALMVRDDADKRIVETHRMRAPWLLTRKKPSPPNPFFSQAASLFLPLTEPGPLAARFTRFAMASAADYFPVKLVMEDEGALKAGRQYVIGE